MFVLDDGTILGIAVHDVVLLLLIILFIVLEETKSNNLTGKTNKYENDRLEEQQSDIKWPTLQG